MKRTKTDWTVLAMKDELASRGDDIELLVRGLIRDTQELLEKNMELVANIRFRNQYRGSGERELEKIMQKEIHEAMYLQLVISKLCGHEWMDGFLALDAFVKLERVRGRQKGLLAEIKKRGGLGLLCSRSTPRPPPRSGPT